jgi:hypothetical protein
MKKTMILVLGLTTLLSLGGLALSETPQPVAMKTAALAQPAAPTGTADLDATIEAPETGGALDGSVSSETSTAEKEVEVTLDELLDMLMAVVTDFRTTGLLAGFIALVALLIYALRYPRLNGWLEAKGWKPYKVYIAAGLAGASVGLATVAAGEVWWKALLAGIAGIVAGLASTGLHQARIAGNQSKEKSKKKKS